MTHEEHYLTLNYKLNELTLIHKSVLLFFCINSVNRVSYQEVFQAPSPFSLYLNTDCNKPMKLPPKQQIPMNISKLSQYICV